MKPCDGFDYALVASSYNGGKRALIDNPAILTGVVLSGAHGIFEVHTDDGIVRCTLRGKLKKAFAQAQADEAALKRRGKPGNKALAISHARRSQSEQVSAGRRDSSVAARTKKDAGQAGIEKQVEETPAIVRLTVGDYVKLRRLDEST